MRLSEKTAFITGAASGFGRATALRFAQEGANIILADLNLAGAQEVQSEVEALGVKAMSVAMDVSSEESVKAAFATAFAQFPVIEILVNSAGLGRSAKIEDLSLADWQKLVDINQTGTFLCCREIVPQMVERQYGKIVNVASICAQTGRLVGVDYAASKSAVAGLTRSLAVQVAPDGVNVNAVAPGPVATPLFEKNYDPATVEKLMSTIPYKRRGKAEDIANLILFLASDESTWITGEVVAINGGAFIG